VKTNRKNASRPIVVGVTGHRDLAANDPALSELVGKELGKVVRTYGHAPLLILSGLAEGADRLVANVARDAFGAKLWAILPLPDALYARDFKTAESLADYKALKADAERVIDAPLLASRRPLANYVESRSHQYAWIGTYIAKRAQLLLTIWDGAPARGTAGTAHVIGWFLTGTVPGAYLISRAPRIAARENVTPALIHINSETHKVRRFTRR
jgi:hypothetical protein